MATAAGFAVGAVAAGAAILRFEADNALQNGPSYIKDGVPGSAPAQIGQAIARQACRRYADGVDSLLDEATVNFETVCRPYLDNIGYGGPPSLTKPFDGGQCAGVLYRMVGDVNYKTFNGGTGQTNDSTRNVGGEINLLGPIGGVSFRYDTPGVNGPRRWIMDVQTGAGLVEGYRVFLNPISTNSVSAAVFNGSFTDASGTTGECGNPPPELTDPVPPPSPGPETEPYNPGPNIDVDINLDINVDGSINVDLGFGPIIINPFGGDVDLGGGGGDGGPPPGDVGEPGPPGETTAGGDLFSSAPPGSVLVGVKVDILQVPIFAKEFDVGVFRGVAYIYMGVGALLDHDPAGAMLRDGQFVFAEKDNLTTWRVRATVGYNLRVTPYYRQVATEES